MILAVILLAIVYDAKILYDAFSCDCYSDDCILYHSINPYSDFDLTLSSHHTRWFATTNSSYHVILEGKNTGISVKMPNERLSNSCFSISYKVTI